MSLETFLKAESLEKESRKDEAIAGYSDFIAECLSSGQPLGPDLHEKLVLAYNNRGFLQYLKVEFRLAIQDFTNALEQDNNFAIAFYNRGLVLYRLSRFEEAVKDLTRALALKSDLEPAQQCLQQSLKDLELRARTESTSREHSTLIY